MTTLSQLRDLVWQQTETTDTELPSSTIDDYLSQAFDRTVHAEVRWPSYQDTQTLTQTTGLSTLTLPATMDSAGIMSIVDDEANYRLSMIDNEEAEDRFYNRGVPPTGARALWFSVWGSTIQLWPQATFSEDRDYTLRGYRLPQAFPTAAGSEPDCDSRLHKALAHYATALAYAQQEDLELENQYMRRWQQDVELARQVIMAPNHQHPLIMGPSVEYITPIGPRSGRTRRAWTISGP